METSYLKNPEWWASVALNMLMSPPRVVLDFAKLISKTGGEEALAHTQAVLGKLYNDPLPIDQDGSELTLCKIYVTPSAIYHNDKYPEKDDKNAEKVPLLIDALLNTIETSTSPIIIHGQPGHGKTSSVRMLTQAIIATEQEKEKPECSIVLFYEFKYLGRLNDREVQILSRRTPFVKDESFFHGKQIVLILDGIDDLIFEGGDERQITDGSDYTLKDFIRNMFVLSENINQRGDSRLNLIFTGRSQFIKDIGSAFTSAYHLFGIENFSKAQVDRWLEKYCNIRQIDPMITYQHFTDKELHDLIHQPIMLTISAIMLADQQIGKAQRAISHEDIYRSILTSTYRKKWQCHPSCADLPDETSYHQFLQVLAFILFRNGEEKIKISSLIDAMKQDNRLYGLEMIKNKDDETIEKICRNISVSFFFTGLEENAFSFIHKSIRDYLIAEAVFELLKEVTKNFKPKKIEKSCDDMAADIYFILGKSALSPEDHIPFLKDIIASQKKAAKEMFKPLETFFKSAQEHIYLIKNENGQNDNPFKTEANVLSGLLYVLTNIFQSLSEDDRKEFYPDGSLKLFDEEKGLYRIISLLNITDIKYKFDFSGADLNHADLSNADLFGANLRDAITDEKTILPDYLKKSEP